MKLATFLVFVFSLHTAASVYSQSTRLSLNMHQISIKEVLQQIESQTEFRFIYENEKINFDKKVDISVTDENVEQILNRLFENEKVSFKVNSNNLILIKPSGFDQGGDAGVKQSKTIQGKVTGKDGQPIPGVSVIVKETTVGTVTDAKGNFQLIIPAGFDKLQFSFIGMRTQELIINGKTQFSVVMEEDAIGLEEVVAIGYGTIKKSDLTGSVASVSSKDITNSSANSVTEVLQGRAAGVQISTGDASPGGGVNIRIRGTSTINSTTEPLYIVDGFPINSNSEDMYVTGGIAENLVEGYQANKVRPNALSMINPYDIESIEILKDASATAIYGARGANGVVLIKTKRGSSGETKINFNYSYSIQKIANKIPRFTGPEYAEWINEGYRNSGYNFDYYDGSAFYRPKPEDAITVDWQDLIYRDAPTKNYSLSFVGGNERTKYLISGDYFNQEGIIIESGFERATTRINIDQQVREFLKIGANVNLSHSKNNRVPTGSDIISTNIVREVLEAPVTQDPEWFDNQTGRWFLNPDDANDKTNPLKMIEDTFDELTTNRIIGNTYAEINILKGLTFYGNVGIDYSNGERQTYLKRTLVTSQEIVNGGHATVGNTIVSRWMSNGYLNWEKSIKKHNITATAGMETQTQIRDTRYMSAERFDSDDLGIYAMTTGAAGKNVDVTRVKWQMLSYFARVNYNFNNKYYLTANFRADGSSRFGESNKWGFFPSIAGSWRLSEEDFVKEMNLFSHLKLRASYGETGNGEISPYSSLGTWAFQANAYNFNGQLVNGAFLSRMSNPDLKWETTSQYNIGFDAGFFDNRLGLTFDYYLKNTDDLIIAVSVPITSGFSSALKNVGSLRNEGAEFTITGVPVTGKFKWDVNYNMSFMKSMATNLGENTYLDLAGWARVGGVRLQVDKPASLIMGTVFDGVFANQDEINNWAKMSGTVKPGYYKPRDIDGDGQITSNDQAPLGNGQPDFIFGLTNNFSYRNFDLNVFIQGSYGNEIAMMYNGDMYEIRENSWTVNNPNNAKYGINAIDGNGNARISNMNVYDGSYIRLKEVRMGYNIPVSKYTKWVETAKVYLSASNLLTITDYPGYNPDVSSGGSWAFGEGFDMGVYPLSKIYKVGVNITF